MKLSSTSGAKHRRLSSSSTKQLHTFDSVLLRHENSDPCPTPTPKTSKRGAPSFGLSRGGEVAAEPAIGLFVELGWQVSGPPPATGVAGEPRDAGLPGRETKGEVVLVPRLGAALERLNPALPPQAITAAGMAVIGRVLRRGGIMVLITTVATGRRAALIE